MEHHLAAHQRLPFRWSARIDGDVGAIVGAGPTDETGRRAKMAADERRRIARVVHQPIDTRLARLGFKPAVGQQRSREAIGL